MSEFETGADEYINELIEDLCSKASRCFESEKALRQSYIDQIAQLRAAQNPVIKMVHKNK